MHEGIYSTISLPTISIPSHWDSLGLGSLFNTTVPIFFIDNHTHIYNNYLKWPEDVSVSNAVPTDDLVLRFGRKAVNLPVLQTSTMEHNNSSSGHVSVSDDSFDIRDVAVALSSS